METTNATLVEEGLEFEDPAERMLDFEIARGMVLMPRYESEIDEDSEDAAHTVFAASALLRVNPKQPLELRVPKTDAASVLQHIGLCDSEKIPLGARQAVAGSSFASLDSLGMVVAVFAREEDEASARAELEADYVFVPNFPLSLPARRTLPEVDETRGRTTLDPREWPDASGVGDAHGRGIRGAGVLIGVLDTGVDADHPEFAHQTVTYRYIHSSPRDVRGFDTNGHGTHVSGIIAGRNIGVAPEARLYAASVIESETTRTSLIRVVSGLQWLLRNFSTPENAQLPAVLNMSLGFPARTPAGIDETEYTQRLRIMRRALRGLRQANVLPVAAIGNEGEGAFRYPGGFRDVLSVGAVDFSGKVAPFSGSGDPLGEGVSKPDFVGYGVGVYSSVGRDYEGRSLYERFSGTSMATPYVTGIAALYRCRQPKMSVEDTWGILAATADDLAGEPSNRVGVGLTKFVP